MRARLFTAAVIPALVAGMLLSSPAHAQEQSQPQRDLQSVAVQPVGTDPNDPNNGQWFVAEAREPGKPLRMKASITNVERVPQTVKLYLADLEFTADGTPQVKDRSTDIGTWGAFDTPEVTVPAQSKVEVAFSVTAPPNADPGDHVGVVVAESKNATGGGPNQLSVVKRVATRLYVTIPGDAKADFAVEEVKLSKDSSFFTRQITTKVILHNTGRVKIHPTVFVNGTKAEGSSEILSRSVEAYYLTESVPLWGGPRRSSVEVRTLVNDASGPARQASASTFVMPWMLLIGIVLLAGLVMASRWLLRRRGNKYTALAADMKRIERLLSEQRAGVESNGNGRPETPEQAIKAAMKRAARVGDDRAEDRLRQKLEEHQRAAAPPPPAAPPAPPKVERPKVERAQAPPAPEVTIVGEASMHGHGNQPPADADSLAVTLIRSALERARTAGDHAEVARLEAKLERERAIR